MYSNLHLARDSILNLDYNFLHIIIRKQLFPCLFTVFEGTADPIVIEFKNCDLSSASFIQFRIFVSFNYFYLIPANSIILSDFKREKVDKSLYSSWIFSELSSDDDSKAFCINGSLFFFPNLIHNFQSN